jgi:hypothetical protein
MATAKKSAEKDPCWDGYKKEGMKKKNGKSVPNCVPEKKAAAKKSAAKKSAAKK